MISITNRSHTISHNAPVAYVVPDSSSADYRESKKQEYILRGYHEYQECISRGGYAYMETLTYDKHNLPVTHGIPHFSREHIRNFLKRLRINLSRRGFDVEENLRYFLSSEYGSETHRPHYHVLFYVNVPKLSPLELRNAVKDAWPYGFNNGLFGEHNYSHYVISDKKNTGPVNYVSKYVAKDLDYSEHVDQRVYRLKEDGVEFDDDTLKDMAPFHRQSIGFGLSYLGQLDFAQLVKYGYLLIPDKKFGYRKMAVPQYYMRKMFYNQTSWLRPIQIVDPYNPGHTLDSFEKVKVWKLTEFGREYKLLRLDSLISSVAERYEAIHDNLASLLKGDEKVDVSRFKESMTSLLDGRSWLQFAKYSVVYRNHIYRGDRSQLPDYRDFYLSSITDHGEINQMASDDDQERKSARRYYMSNAINETWYDEFDGFDQLWLMIRYVEDSTEKHRNYYQRKIEKQNSKAAILFKRSA